MRTLKDFIELCTGSGADPKAVLDGAKQGPGHDALSRRWYSSIEQGTPDFGVYSEDSYLGELWYCWTAYSRGYLRNIRNPKLGIDGVSIVEYLKPLNVVVDLGCGPGLTCEEFKRILPGARVYGTNRPGLLQTQIAEYLARESGFGVLCGDEAMAADLVFASEYFEHFQDPISHLSDVLKRFTPRALLIANAFGAQAIGHFPSYRPENLPGPTMSRRFNAYLRKQGYTKITTKLWSQRPTLWRLTNETATKTD